VKWREFFIVLALVAMVVTFVSKSRKEPTPEPTASPTVMLGEPVLSIQVVGRPRDLDSLLLRCRLRSQQSIRLSLSDGVPTGRLSIGNSEKSFDLYHYDLLKSRPASDNLLNLGNETKTVEHFSWEVNGKDLITEHSGGSGLEPVSQLFSGKLQLTYSLYCEVKENDGSGYKVKRVRGSAVLSPLK
jgi:hypothetical protein